MLEFVAPAVEKLCAAFEKGGYNPTPVIDLGILVANADGKVDDRERALLKELFSVLLDTTLTSDIVDHLVTASLEVIEQAGSDKRASLIAAILRDCDAVEDGLRVALTVAFASEGYSDAERHVIERIAEEGRVDDKRLVELVKEVRLSAPGGPSTVRRSLVPPPKL